VSEYSAETLARQLAQLGRELDAEVAILGELEEASADMEGEYRRLKSAYDDCVDRSFLHTDGGVEARKAEARLACTTERALMHEANLEWDKAKGRVFTQNANLRALHDRIDIGRSLLSREKALLSLSGIGEV
jgi:hypothetical protein